MLTTIIICIILAAICAYSIVSYKKKLNSGCCGSGGGEIKVKPGDTDLTHYPYKLKVYIDGMTCEHCKMRIENAFNRTDGFYAKVNLKKKYALLASMKPVDTENIKNIVEHAGYKYIKTDCES